MNGVAIYLAGMDGSKMAAYMPDLLRLHSSLARLWQVWQARKFPTSRCLRLLKSYVWETISGVYAVDILSNPWRLHIKTKLNAPDVHFAFVVAMPAEISETLSASGSESRIEPKS